MAAFVQARYGGSFDYHAGFEAAARKHSTSLEDYNYNSNYPVFNDDANSSNNKHCGPVDVLRSFSQNYQSHQNHQPQTQHGQGNNFTFNQSITHVNLINNRFQIDIPTPHQPAYSNNHGGGSASVVDFPSIGETNMAMNISPNGNHTLPFSRSTEMNNVSRLNTSSYTQNHHNESYSSPQPQINSSSPNDHFMGMFHTSQSSYPSSMKPSEDFHHMPSLTKYPSPDHPMSLPPNSMKSEMEYSPNGYYTDHPGSLMNSNNNNCSIPSSMQSSNISRMQSIYSQNGDPKLNDHDVEQVNDTQKCKNTLEGTKTSVRRFKRWHKENFNKEIDMNTVNCFNAPELLKNFFIGIRDTRPGRVGNEYEPVTLTTYRNGLRRYFLYRKMPPAPDNFDLTDKAFDIVNKHLVTKRDDLKRKGKGNHPNAIESITPEQLEKMWASGAIGTHAPRPLLRLQWWFNTVCHGVRGRMAHHDLTMDDFELKRGLDGKLTMEYIKNGVHQQPASMSPNMEPTKKKKSKGIVKQTDGGDRDPIRAFEIYKAHRPEGIQSFYLTPKNKPKGNIWFNKVPMGKNSIGRMMREIKGIASI